MLANQAGDSRYNPVVDLAFTIDIVDTPWIELLGNNPLTVYYGQPFVDPGVIVHDDIDTDLVASVSGLLPILSAVENQQVGSFILSYDAVDSSLNHAATVTRQVDVTPPARRRRVHDEDTNAMMLIAQGLTPTGIQDTTATPTPTPTETPVESPTPSVTPEATPTPTPTETPVESPTESPTPSATPELTPAPTPEETPTPTPTPVVRRTPAATPHASVPVEPSPSETPSEQTAAIGTPGLFGRIWGWISGLF